MLPIPLYVPGADPDEIERAKVNLKDGFPWVHEMCTDDFMCCKCEEMFSDEDCHSHRRLKDDIVICHSCYLKSGGADLRGK